MIVRSSQHPGTFYYVGLVFALFRNSSFIPWDWTETV